MEVIHPDTGVPESYLQTRSYSGLDRGLVFHLKDTEMELITDSSCKKINSWSLSTRQERSGRTKRVDKMRRTTTIRIYIGHSRVPLLQNECSANTFCRLMKFIFISHGQFCAGISLIWNRGTRFILWKSPLPGTGKYCSNWFVLPKNTGLIWRGLEHKKHRRTIQPLALGTSLDQLYGWNSPFPSSSKPLHQSEACAQPWYKMSLICKWMKSQFYMKGWHQGSLSERGLKRFGNGLFENGCILPGTSNLLRAKMIYKKPSSNSATAWSWKYPSVRPLNSSCRSPFHVWGAANTVRANKL